MSNVKKILLAIFMPIIGSWFVMQVQFSLGATIANGLLVIPLPLVGMYFASQIEIDSRKLKIAAMIFYVATIFVAIGYVALSTSCANGDCI